MARPRFLILGVEPTRIVHSFKASKTPNGKEPTDNVVASEADKFDPIVKAGNVYYNDLEHGGLFALLGEYKKNMVVERIENEAGATGEIVDRAGAKIRDIPTDFPFKMGPYEWLSFSGGTAQKFVAVTVRLEGNKQL